MNKLLSHLFCMLFSSLLLSSFSSCDKSDATDDPENAPSDLIAHWAFDGNGADSSGNGHTATIHNLSFDADRFGKAKGAYYFNGISGFASVDDKSDLRLNNTDFTISAWVKLDRYAANILSKRIRGANNGWQTSVSGPPNDIVGVLSFGPGGGSVNAWGSKEVSLDGWHLLVSVYKQSDATLSLFVDGVLDNITTGVLAPNKDITASLFIGKDESTNSYLKGSIDDVRIYRRAFSSAEVQQFYSATKGPSDELIAYWPFDGDGKDLSGNANSATLYNLTSTADRFCNPVGAFYFNGTNGYASVADKPALRLNSTDFTLNSWVKLEAYNSSYGSIIMSKRIPGANTGWQTSIAGHLSSPLGVSAYGPGGGSINAWGTKKVELNGWHMVTSVYKLSSQALSIYIDGVFDNTTTGVLTANGSISSMLNIGKDGATNIYFLKGALDDIRIYGRALTNEEVEGLYNRTKGGCNTEE